MKKIFAVIGVAVLSATVVVMSLDGPRDGINETATMNRVDAVIRSHEAVESVSQAPGAAPSDTPDTPDTPETEIVMGIEVLKDRSCTVSRHFLDLGNGIVTDAFSCIQDERAPDDYELYSLEELKVMAYSDAKAAGVLGKRLAGTNLREAREWILRAVALEPGNIEPAMWLASQAYSLRGNSRAAVRATANAYIITQTLNGLGSNKSVDWIIEDLRKLGFRDEHIAALDESVSKDLMAVRDVQVEVYGQSLIAEGSP